MLITFSSVLRQKGAAHSRKEGAGSHRRLSWNLASRSGPRDWLYDNSLSLAFGALFVTAFALHVVFGHRKYNEDQALQHLPPMALGAYAASSNLWFLVFQCWEAEFAVIGLYVVLSIFLRQEDSPESKRLGTGDQETGGINE